MLTGVCTESSARTKEGWLSDEACLVGMSKLGVPDLLSGLEKLKEGLGRPEESEATDGDRWNEPALDKMPGAAKAVLPDESFRLDARSG